MDLTPLTDGLKPLGLALGPSQIQAFDSFGRSLYEANAVVNMTRVPEGQCAVRHFLDALLLAPLLPQGSSVLDLGTGPGIPAWPLACARPDLIVTALDSWGKGLEFLRQHPLQNLTVVEARAEELGLREAFDVVTGRAFAPFAVQAEASAPWVKVGGLFAPFRTPPEREVVQAFPARLLGLELRECRIMALPDRMGQRMFPMFDKVKPTDPRYPRRWAEMKARPIGD